jgi:hypothetical protein
LKILYVFQLPFYYFLESTSFFEKTNEKSENAANSPNSEIEETKNTEIPNVERTKEGKDDLKFSKNKIIRSFVK